MTRLSVYFLALPALLLLMTGCASVGPSDISKDDGFFKGCKIEKGAASYYADKFNGRKTASGERFNNAEMTAAHKTLPFGTQLIVHNPANGKEVTVRVNDRGPFIRGRVIDVSKAAARELGLIGPGVAPVEVRRCRA